jgi:hypothetical protein
MRPICIALVVAGVVSSLGAQTAPQQPQTARQALIEMFMSKNPDDFAKHLPDDARQALIHKGETPSTSVVLRIASLGRGMTAQGEHIKTFDVGPNILVSEQPDHERIEIGIERDSLMGEQDEIELSVHSYKNGQEEFIPVVPRLIFILQQEKEIWRLTELTVEAHVPLTDPDYLKGVRKEQNEANENAALVRMNTTVEMQKGYATQHPEAGYSCALTAFAPQFYQQGTPTDGTAATDGGNAPADPQGNHESNGYRFSITGCAGTPSMKYRLIAVPTDADSDMKTFCADESGKVRFITTGKPSSCFSSGQNANPEAQAVPAADTE